MTTEQWLAQIGSAKARDERVAQRLAGKLNAPMKGIRGLGNIVARMAGTPSTVGHKWECVCERCRPWMHDGRRTLEKQEAAR